MPLLRLDDLALRFIFPHAPFRSVTINGGMVMRAWYDMRVTPAGVAQNAADIAQARGIVTALIESERARGMAAERIVLAGFSQGGAIVLHAGLRYPQALAGLLTLSAPVPERDPGAHSIGQFNRHHGASVTRSYQMRLLWWRHVLAIDWRGYPMGHQSTGVDSASVAAGGEALPSDEWCVETRTKLLPKWPPQPINQDLIEAPTGCRRPPGHNRRVTGRVRVDSWPDRLPPGRWVIVSPTDQSSTRSSLLNDIRVWSTSDTWRSDWAHSSCRHIQSWCVNRTAVCEYRTGGFPWTCLEFWGFRVPKRYDRRVVKLGFKLNLI